MRRLRLTPLPKTDEADGEANSAEQRGLERGAIL